MSFVKFPQNIFLEELEFCMLFSTLHSVKKNCLETLLVTTLGPFVLALCHTKYCDPFIISMGVA